MLVSMPLGRPLVGADDLSSMESFSSEGGEPEAVSADMMILYASSCQYGWREYMLEDAAVVHLDGRWVEMLRTYKD